MLAKYSELEYSSCHERPGRGAPGRADGTTEYRMTAAATSIETTVFGSPVRVLIGSQLADGMLPLSARLADREAYHRFLEWDPDTSIVRVDDQEEFRRFLNDCHGRHALPRRLLGHALVVRH